jgi:small-conductance mechanosensitive channel
VLYFRRSEGNPLSIVQTSFLAQLVLEPDPKKPKQGQSIEDIAETVRDFWDDPLGFDWFEFAGTTINLGVVLALLGFLTAAWLLSMTVQRALTRGLRGRKLVDEGAAIVTSRLVHYAIMLFGLFIGLKAIGIDLGTLLATGAVFAVVIGFALQNIAQNFVAGVILMVERTIKPNDILSVDGSVVRVVSMGIRATVARTRDDEEIIVPNSQLVQSSVKNYTLGNSNFRLRAYVGVHYDSDMRRVRKVLEEAAEGIPWRLRDEPPRVQLLGFGDSSVNWEVSVWMADPWKAPASLSRLNEVLWFALKESGITIAYPQQDVHLDAGFADRLAEAIKSAGSN